MIEIVTKNPESYNGHKILAMLYEKEGGQRKAVDEYAQVISINPKDNRELWLSLEQNPLNLLLREVVGKSRSSTMTANRGVSIFMK